MSTALSPLHWLAVVAALLGGLAVGLGSGWLSVKLEVVEGLEQEDVEDRVVFDREVAEAIASAAAEGKPAPKLPKWESEPFGYGWTWLERYLLPVVTALSWALFTYHENTVLPLLFHLAWLAVLVHLVAFDLKHRLILNSITYPATLAALLASFFTPDVGIVRALTGAVVIYAFFMAQSLALRGAIGQGDAKLGAFMGATAGLGLDLNHLGAVYAVIYGVLLGGLAAVILLVTRVRSLRDPIPYGPFLCAGVAVILYTGTPQTMF